MAAVSIIDPTCSEERPYEMSAADSPPIKVEQVLAELNRQRSDLEKDLTDPEYFAIHHAFCFISYKMNEFQKYLTEVVKPGEHP